MVENDVAATPKKAKVAKVKKPKTAPAHPPVAKMVTSAITDLKERGGSSLAAIKKYISANFKVDADKMSPFIRKYLKSAVASGSLTQTKGKGANGSFKIGGKEAATKPKKTAGAGKPKKPKASSPKKAAKPKKAPAAKKSLVKAKPASPKKPKAAKLAAKPKKATLAAPKRKKVTTTRATGTRKRVTSGIKKKATPKKAKK